MVPIDELRKEAKRLLASGKVQYVVGYRRGPDPLIAAPLFARDPDQVDELVWDSTCVQNLVGYLRDEKRRRGASKDPDTRPIGIVVKGCDSRAVNVLLQEKYIDREDVYLIGVSCEGEGVVDDAKVRRRLGGDRPEALFWQDGELVAEVEGGTISWKPEEVLAERCLECQAAHPVVHDVVYGVKKERQPETPYGSVEPLEAESMDRRAAFWRGELGRCIRCYACRSVCPMCYCDECVVDSINMAVGPTTTAEEKARKSKWIEKSPVAAENCGYHLVRAMHLAGRCIDCGECQRVCPVDIPLRFLNKKLEKSAKVLFDYRPGFDPEAPALVSSYRDDDPGDFIW